MSIRWVVRDGDGDTVAAVVARAGGDSRAIAEGRVFVGRVRARDGGERVARGDEVRIAAAKRESKAADVRIVFSDEGLLVAEKPAGIPTIPDHAGAASSLVAVAARAAGVSPSALHPTSRLDRDVSGVVVFARNERAAERIARARADGAYARRYVAIASGAPSADHGVWNEPIGRAADPRHRAVGGKKATDAATRFRVVARTLDGSVLSLDPITGRTHQLRVHSAHAGAPLLGDRVYGGPRTLTLREGPSAGKVIALDRIALHAARVEVLGHVFEAPVPEQLEEVWESLGGDPSAWDTALTCTTGND